MSRLISGASLSLNNIGCFSILTSEFPAVLEKAIGYVELVSSFGYSFGPLLLSLLFELASPKAAFILYGLLVALSSIPLFFIQLSAPTDETRSEKASRLTLLGHAVQSKQPILANVVALLILNFGLGGFDALIALHLQNEGMSPFATACIYAIYTLGYLAFAAIPPYVPQIFPRRYLVLIGLVASALAFFLAGQSSVWLICIGVCLVGVGYAFVFSKLQAVPVFPIMLRFCVVTLQLADNIQLSDSLSSEISSGMMSMGLSLGMLSGPPVSGLLTEVTCIRDAFQIICLMFVIGAVGYARFSTSKEYEEGYLQLGQSKQGTG